MTNVVESTALLEALDDERMAQVWPTHDRIAPDLLVRISGREVGMSHGLLLLIDDALAVAGKRWLRGWQPDSAPRSARRSPSCAPQ